MSLITLLSTALHLKSSDVCSEDEVARPSHNNAETCLEANLRPSPQGDLLGNAAHRSSHLVRPRAISGRGSDPAIAAAVPRPPSAQKIAKEGLARIDGVALRYTCNQACLNGRKGNGQAGAICSL